MYIYNYITNVLHLAPPILNLENGQVCVYLYSLTITQDQSSLRDSKVYMIHKYSYLLLDCKKITGLQQSRADNV